MTPTDLLADLARLLREGLVRIDHDGYELPPPFAGPRFTITPRGRSYVEEVVRVYEDDDDLPSRIHDLRRTESETTQRRTG